MGLGFSHNNKKKGTMKKTLGLLLLSACFAYNAQAQLARGFYRIQNTYTNRYISLTDNNPANYPVSASNITMPGIKTIKPGEAVYTNPSTIYLVYNVGGTQYDMEAQGTSIHYITGGKMYINLDLQSDGSYQAYGTYSGISAWLADDSEQDVDESYLKNRSSKTRNWWARPVDTANEYLGIKPDVEVDGKYYGTIYASFPFKLVSGGMKAYCVTEAAGSGFKMEEISGVIPALTPVIVECSSNSPAENKILPVEDGSELGKTNKLYGALCARVSSRYWNVVPYDATTMRTIGKSDGKLAFVKASGSDLVESLYLRANKAYLLVPNDAASTLVLNGNMDTGINDVKYENTTNNRWYSLDGRELKSEPTKKGIYIKNGKKVIVK